MTSRLRAASIGLGVGVVVMIAGTFAPWLQSGEVTRDSYRTAGLLQRLLDVHGAVGTAIDAMPLLALGCAASAAIFAVGARRSGAGLVGLVAVALAALSIAALVAPGSSGIRVVAWGPAITLGGAALTIAAAVLAFFPGNRR